MIKLNKKQMLALAILGFSIASFPFQVYAEHSWGNYHWARTSNSFTLKLGDNLSDSWKTYLNTTSSSWNVSEILETTVVIGSTTAKRCAAVSGRVEVCNAKYGNNGWLGIAGISVSGSHITKGYVKLNDTYFLTAAYNTPAWRNLVMCQEVGHTFGLDHQDEDFNNENLNTCMDYTSNPDSNQYPNTHDYEQLVTIYSHLDASTTVGQTTSKSPNGFNENDPRQWGKLIKTTRDGSHQVFERDLGHGNKFFTFVTWASKEAIEEADMVDGSDLK
jgi:hypothetical protein